MERTLDEIGCIQGGMVVDKDIRLMVRRACLSLLDYHLSFGEAILSVSLGLIFFTLQISLIIASASLACGRDDKE